MRLCSRTVAESLTLCDPTDWEARQAPALQGILQARVLVWMAISASRDFSDLGWKDRHKYEHS